jgi:hypothetical protein
MVGDFFGLGFAIVMSGLVICLVTVNPLPLLGMAAGLYALSFAGSQVEKSTRRRR